MPDFKIFTESKADIRFISDFVAERFGVILDADSFYALNTWSGYKTGGDVIEAIRQNFDNQAETILILDADNDFEHRRAEVLGDFEGYDIPVHLFLSPDNATAGNLEVMLCEVAVQKDILECFEAYEACIKGYEAPVIKSKVFAYLDALLPAKNKKNNRHDLIQEANRNYRNTAHWDLHHAYLQPLHDFLSPFFNRDN